MSRINDQAVANAATIRLRKELPRLQAITDSISGDRLKVEIGTTTATDGKKIFIAPTTGMATEIEHVRNLCGEQVGAKMLCPACRQTEEITAYLYHELSHVIFGSFIPGARRADVAHEYIGDVWDKGFMGKYCDPETGELKAGARAARERIHGVNEFMPLLINALEDIRVDTQMAAHRVGTQRMRLEILQSALAPEPGKTPLNKTPLNAQLGIALIADAAGFTPPEPWAVEVERAINSGDFDGPLDVLTSRDSTIADTIVTSLHVLSMAKKHGFFLNDIEREEYDNEREEKTGDSGGNVSGDSPNDDDSNADEDSGSGGNDSADGDGLDTGRADGDDDVERPAGDPTGDSTEGDGGDGESAHSRGDGVEAGDADSGEGAPMGLDSGGGRGRAEGDPGDSPGGGGEGEPEAERDPELTPGRGAEDEEGSRGEPGDGGGAPGGPAEGGASQEVDEGSGEEVPGDEEGAAGGEPGGEESGRGPSLVERPADSDVGRPSQKSFDEDWGDLHELTGSAHEDVDGDNPGDASPRRHELGAVGDDETPEDGADRSGIEYGDASDLNEVINILGGSHSKAEEESIGAEMSPSLVRGAIKVAEHLDEPSARIAEVVVAKTGRDRRLRMDVATPAETDPANVRPALIRMRAILDDNKITRHDRNRKSGRINAAALGKRAWNNDPRLFGKRTRPNKKDYAVLIGIDVSGSTAQGLGNGRRIIDIELEAALSQIEVCHSLDIDFAVYAHSGAEGQLHIVEVKTFGQRWDKAAKGRFETLGSGMYNLDGHTFEYYRKRLEEHRATDKILMYYTDGAMPNENYVEELRILKRELKILEKANVTVLGVGVASDSPKGYGIPTAVIRKPGDVVNVVDHLEDVLVKAMHR